MAIVLNGTLPADQVAEEMEILTKLDNEVYPKELPAGIQLRDQRTYRDIFNNVITVQIFQDSNWGEYRLRSIVNGQMDRVINTSYVNTPYSRVEAAMLQDIKSNKIDFT